MKIFTLFKAAMCYFFLLASQAYAQDAGDYRTNFVGTSGQWTSVSIWQIYDGSNWVAASSVPNASNAGRISISTGDSVVLTGTDLTLARVVVEQGASFLIFSSTTTLNNVPTNKSIDVFGKFYLASSGIITGAGAVYVNPVGYFQVRNSGSVRVNVNNNGVGEFQNTANIANGITYTNNNILNWTSGDINITGGSSLVNQDSLLVNHTANAQLLGVSPSGFINSGYVVKTSNSITTFAIPTTNSGRLLGSGTYRFNNTILNSGIISPGSSPGTLTVTPNPNNPIVAGSTVAIEIINNTPGTGYDVLNVNNSASIAIGGTLQVTADNSAPLGTYTIISFSQPFTGTFNSVSVPTGFDQPVYDYANNRITIQKTSTLPVSWGNFNVIQQNGNFQLTWSTEQEVNNSHFEVEYAHNQGEFESVARIEGQGNSFVRNSYRYTLQTNKAGLLKFRIKQVDLDGKFSYSPVRVIRTDNPTVTATFGPNPVVSNQLSLSLFSSSATVNIRSINGSLLKSWNLQNGVYNLNLNGIPKGMVILSIQVDQNKIENHRLIIQ